MTASWAQTERSGWLCKLYGKIDESGSKKLPEESVQSQIVGILEVLLSFDTSPKDSAAKTASLILSREDVDTPWNNLLGLILDAAENFTEEKELGALVDYVVELASLPDAVNEAPETKILEKLSIEPGQAIVFEEGKLWSDLPGFSANVTERFQGT